MTLPTRSRLALVAALVAALLLPAAADVQAQTLPSDDGQSVRLPAGWSLAFGADGALLRWRSPERLPWGGAALEVRKDGRPFAQAVLRRDLRTVTAQLSTEQSAALAQAAGAPALTVWSGDSPSCRRLRSPSMTAYQRHRPWLPPGE